jgi:hypothetical protein
MINGKLQEFVGDVANRRRINFGDVRRLQRVFLPRGITNREEMEVLISLNTKLLRADKAWAKWLVAAVEDFFVTQAECGKPAEDTADHSVEHLLAASAANVDRKIARQIRRALAKPRTTESRSPGKRPAAQGDSANPGRNIRERTDDRSIRNDTRTTHRTFVRPVQRSFCPITHGTAIAQFPVWFAADRYRLGRFSTGHGVGDVLARPYIA